MDKTVRPGWPWIAATVVGVPVLYVASFGPACWSTSRLGYGADLLPTIYRPLMRAMVDEKRELETSAAYSWMIGRPETVPLEPAAVLARFARFGAPPGWSWHYSAIYTIRPEPMRSDSRIRLRDEAWRWGTR